MVPLLQRQAEQEINAAIDAAGADDSSQVAAAAGRAFVAASDEW
jgi:hypothetical protein